MAPAWSLLQPLSLGVTMLGVSPVLGTLWSGPPKAAAPKSFQADSAGLPCAVTLGASGTPRAPGTTTAPGVAAAAS